ncbi:uncharacterized protein UHO2_00353 [Ustilago hordei]|uniref:uncharacterized protein n=1 Tax=Ustilago hordei TaxID=120017 RepID=UPI001A3BBBF1|nr:uncharacterized protein UHO2_00353 [Ustilago hordei]SYW81848.1 uncharacterized protein UHO2_00353 [Ustilago hordei]
MFETKETEGKCYRLKKALYGLKQAGHLCHAALDEQLQAFGFKRCQAEPCIYAHGSSNAMVFLAVYVDDLLIIGATAMQVQSVQQQLSSVFSNTDQDQKGYIEGILMKYGMDQAWVASTPVTEAINTLKPQEGDVMGLDAQEAGGSRVTWAWMLKKQEGHGFIWKEHRYRRSSRDQ